jgi:hypothetical protein
MRLKVILVLVLVIASIVVITHKENCTNAFSVQDYTESKKGSIKICDKAVYYNDSKIVDDKENSELFHYKLSNKIEDTKQYVRIFEDNKQTYIGIISVIDYASWFKSTISVYKKEPVGFKEIFKLPFKDVPGRFAKISFVNYNLFDYHNIEVSGDVGYLGCYGCLINWVDYYRWDSKKQNFVLVNNQHKREFEDLLKRFEEQNQSACLETSGTPGVISELYPARKDSKGFCDDRAIVPYITTKQAKTLLQAIRAAKLIIKNDNISSKEVKNIVIE